MILYAKDDHEQLYGIDRDWQNQPAEPGISFLIRSRSEERPLDMAIYSLRTVTVPHETVLIINGSEIDVPPEWPVRYFNYSPNLGRPGVENLLTPFDSIHSLAWFYNWCLSKTRFSYIFKYDADMVASRVLIDQLPSVLSGPPAVYDIKLAYADTLMVNEEAYLFPKEPGPYYESYYFWEIMKMRRPCSLRRLSGSILHDTTLSSPKEYSRSPAWWHGTEQGEELERKCQEIAGKIGMRFARASDPETGAAFNKYMELLKEEAIAGQPSVGGFLSLSLSYGKSGKYRECIAAAKKAIELNPDCLGAYINICAAYNQLGNFAEGKKAGEIALQLQPNNLLAKNNLKWSIDGLNKK